MPIPLAWRDSPLFRSGSPFYIDLHRGNPKLEGSEFAGDGYFLNNFNDVFSAYITLFELTVVNQWHVLVEGYDNFDLLLESSTESESEFRNFTVVLRRSAGNIGARRSLTSPRGLPTSTGDLLLESSTEVI